MKTYKCPVCGKEYTDLMALSACVQRDANRQKALEQEQAIQKQRYFKAIAESRANLEESFKTLKTAVEAYNRLVTEANMKAGVRGATAQVTLGFEGTFTGTPITGTPITATDLLKQLKEKVDTAKIREDGNDLASIIFRNLGI